MPIEVEELNKRFTHHAPKGDQPQRYILICEEAKALAQTIVLNSQPSREQALALTKLEECVMWVNAGIARNE